MLASISFLLLSAFTQAMKTLRRLTLFITSQTSSKCVKFQSR